MVPRRAGQGTHNGPLRHPNAARAVGPAPAPATQWTQAAAERSRAAHRATPATDPHHSTQSPQLLVERNASIFEYSAQYNNTGVHLVPQAAGPLTANVLLFHVGTSVHLKLFLDMSQGCSARVPCTSRGNYHTGRLFFGAPHRPNRPAPPEQVF